MKKELFGYKLKNISNGIEIRPENHYIVEEIIYESDVAIDEVIRQGFNESVRKIVAYDIYCVEKFTAYRVSTEAIKGLINAGLLVNILNADICTDGSINIRTKNIQTITEFAKDEYNIKNCIIVENYSFDDFREVTDSGIYSYLVNGFESKVKITEDSIDEIEDLFGDTDVSLKDGEFPVEIKKKSIDSTGELVITGYVSNEYHCKVPELDDKGYKYACEYGYGYPVTTLLKGNIPKEPLVALLIGTDNGEDKREMFVECYKICVEMQRRKYLSWLYKFGKYIEKEEFNRLMSEEVQSEVERLKNRLKIFGYTRIIDDIYIEYSCDSGKGVVYRADGTGKAELSILCGVTEIAIKSLKLFSNSHIDMPDTVIKTNILCGQRCGAKTIKISKNMVALAPHVFSNCENLERITIHSNIRQIGSGAFEDCKALEEVIIEPGCMKIGEGAFRNCSKLCKLEIPNTVVYIDREFIAETNIDSLVIPGSVMYVQLLDILKNTKLEELTLLCCNSMLLGEKSLKTEVIREMNSNTLREVYIKKGMNFSEYIGTIFSKYYGKTVTYI